MRTKDFIILALAAVVMLTVAITFGQWFENSNPDGLSLSSPAEDEPEKSISPFGFGAAIGLLITSLFYCVVAAGLLLTGKIKNRSVGPLPLAIAILAALGFSLSYFVDGYFLG